MTLPPLPVVVINKTATLAAAITVMTIVEAQPVGYSVWCIDLVSLPPLTYKAGTF